MFFTSAQAPYSVHPRVRGEQFMNTSQCVPALGSSPRARGTEEDLVVPRLDRRFIPACAGNSPRPICPT